MKIKNEVKEITGFWEDEHCEYCNGKIVERRVELYRHKKNGRFLFENVPAGVCISCGSHYYSAHVLKMLDRMVQSKTSIKTTVKIPLVHFA
jgi:YgiT-type zinc finger domain-containing protein